MSSAVAHKRAHDQQADGDERERTRPAPRLRETAGVADEQEDQRHQLDRGKHPRHADEHLAR